MADVWSNSETEHPEAAHCPCVAENTHLTLLSPSRNWSLGSGTESGGSKGNQHDEKRHFQAGREHTVCRHTDKCVAHPEGSTH